MLYEDERYLETLEILGEFPKDKIETILEFIRRHGHKIVEEGEKENLSHPEILVATHIMNNILSLSFDEYKRRNNVH